VSYNDCSDEDIAWAAPLLVPEPTAPMQTPVRISSENFGRVPRIYIETLRDNGVTPWLQKQMYTALPCQRVISMDTSHSPFLSAPEELAAHLLAV
jgi:pimeloyl-ACP methyl ester carboxylesterase